MGNLLIARQPKIKTIEVVAQRKEFAARILVIEDDAELLQFIASYLRELSYDVHEARDGMEGLNLARTIEPDLILLDINLPKLNGFALCRLLKFDEQFKHIPIIMWTWRDSEPDKKSGESAGADYYLPKPFSVRKLQSIIEQLLESRK